ncbi:LANO_0F03048g1_1 [Lachancea nothofagi CBS 11611]|uniref:LANO_0F03048g1_1 n=1 Tax=Lachancea nothofagi CBS 11611 TaxID=1266666 RepID=A0A1G4K6Y5_9SACH|nr:LANO_0F03048g1_1 [Lachancea nothofagi CBS 11611]
MSQDPVITDAAQEPKEVHEGEEVEDSKEIGPESFPALEWDQVQSSIPVESFTNYKIRLNGWARKDRLDKRLEEEAKQREEEQAEQAKKQKLDEDSEQKKEQESTSEKNHEADEDDNDDESESETKTEDKKDAGEEVKSEEVKGADGNSAEQS